MATKRYTPLDDPPSASSDDDETEDEQETIPQNPIHQSPSDSDQHSEQETETEDESPSKPTKSHNPISSSIFEFDSEVRSPTASDFAIKPSKKISPDKTPTSKRPSESVIKGINKKVKVLNGDGDDSEKKSVTKRVWSVEDELMLLQGFIEYQLKTERSPLADMDGFYRFTMSSIPGYASKSQLYEKVRRLKKKFRVMSDKISVSGEEAVLSKPHEGKLFRLSSKIWGVDGCESVSGGGAGAGGGSSAKVKVKVKVPVAKVKAKSEVKREKSEVKEKGGCGEGEGGGGGGGEEAVEVEDFETRYPYWNAGLVSEVSSALKFPGGVVDLVKENLGLIGEAKAKEMNEKWEAVFENEAVLRKRRIALLSKIGDVETA